VAVAKRKKNEETFAVATVLFVPPDCIRTEQSTVWCLRLCTAAAFCSKWAQWTATLYLNV